ncbi:hypothetical protein C6Y14_26055 [Streptomyces dioscori]|uniref:Uncharacterized protein n=1 Tax=Streptomyces dioscori TaxID=2109333 RepID=A0A2P8Q1R4_9ACTN|nr:hypothetical protein [Streptomyces dioscori]PSM40196.1 hypothetical protein C6Y14_26055 [Streptomyces dioscori]
MPLDVVTDPAHGGRWTSLRTTAGREWLWHRDAPERKGVAPGDAFVDAGGLEECVPTVRGDPDHGEAWSRPWTRTLAPAPAKDRAPVQASAPTPALEPAPALAPDPGSVSDPERVAGPDQIRAQASDVGQDQDPGPERGEDRYVVHCDRFTLSRTIRRTPDGAEADYVLTADAGFRFVWAAHALLDLSERASVRIGDGARARLFPEAAPLLARAWPEGAPWVEGTWPDPCGLRMDRFGPDDGTAVGAVVDTPGCCVHDGRDRLSLALEADGQPTSVALWRNLGGFPAGRPYRSTGVEPMLGRVFDLAEANPGDAARVPASGEARWRLTLTTHCRCT